MDALSLPWATRSCSGPRVPVGGGLRDYRSDLAAMAQPQLPLLPRGYFESAADVHDAEERFLAEHLAIPDDVAEL